MSIVKKLFAKNAEGEKGAMVVSHILETLTPENKLSLKFEVNNIECIKTLIGGMKSEDPSVNKLSKILLDGYVSGEELYYALPDLLANKLFWWVQKIPAKMFTKDDLTLLTKYWRYDIGEHQYFESHLGKAYLKAVADFSPEELGDILQDLITCQWLDGEQREHQAITVKLINKVPSGYIIAQFDELVARKNEYDTIAQRTSIRLVLQVLMSDVFPKENLADHIKYLFECYLIGGASDDANEKRIKTLLMEIHTRDLESNLNYLLSIEKLEDEETTCYNHELKQTKHVSAQLVLKVLQEYNPTQIGNHLEYILKLSKSDDAEVAEGYTGLMLQVLPDALTEEDVIFEHAPSHLKIALLEEFGIFDSARREIFA